MTMIDWALVTERAVGRNHPTLDDVLNRALRQVMTASGADPDADFTGFSLVGHGHAYGDLADIPATFAPSAHEHTLTDLQGFGAAGGYMRSDGLGWTRSAGVAWTDLTGVPGTFTPAAHVHPIAQVTGLQDALNTKSAVGHTHSYASLTGIPATFAPSAHFHAPNELTGFGADGGYLRSNGSGWARASGLAAADLTGTIGSARLAGAYAGITGVGTLTSLDVTGAAAVGGRLTIVGDVLGGLTVGGEPYSHVLVAVGLNGHPLTAIHQVGVYSAVRANAFASGAGSFNAGFETAIGTQNGAFTLEAAANFSVGSLTKGVGSTITRSWGLATYEEVAALHNATIAPLDATWTGNWFIYYPHARPSHLGGPLTLASTLALTGSEAFHGAADSYVRIAGGAAAADGAHIMLSGPSHPTVPGRLYLSAVGTGSVVMRAGNKEFTFDAAGTFAGGAGTIFAPQTLTVSGAFGCNGAAAQGKATLGGTATDLPSAILLANNTRTALINNGIGQS